MADDEDQIHDPTITLHADGRGHFYALLKLTASESLSSEWVGSPEVALVVLVEKMRKRYELWASTPMRLLDPQEVAANAYLGLFVGGKG